MTAGRARDRAQDAVYAALRNEDAAPRNGIAPPRKGIVPSRKEFAPARPGSPRCAMERDAPVLPP